MCIADDCVNHRVDHCGSFEVTMASFYKCGYCDIIFDDKDAANQHVAGHLSSATTATTGQQALGSEGSQKSK